MTVATSACSLQVGLKSRDAKIHRETGRTQWYADEAQQLRYQDSIQGAVALPLSLQDHGDPGRLPQYLGATG